MIAKPVLGTAGLKLGPVTWMTPTVLCARVTAYKGLKQTDARPGSIASMTFSAA